MKAIAGLIVAAMLLGVAGCSIPAEAAPAETKTVTATVTATPPPVTKYEYVESVKEITPEVCIETMDLMAQYLAAVAELGPLSGESTKAAYDHDTFALNMVSAKLERLRVRLEGISTPLATAAAQCRLKREMT